MKRRLPQARQSQVRLEQPTILDRALAEQHGRAYVQLAAFAIDVDRAFVAEPAELELGFGWEVFLTECYLVARIDSRDQAARVLLEDTCLSMLEQPPDEQGYGSQLLFAVYDAIERGYFSKRLRPMFRVWRSRPKQLGRALDALFASATSELTRCARHCLGLALDPPLAPPTREALIAMRDGKWLLPVLAPTD